jgi:hypothetical protein
VTQIICLGVITAESSTPSSITAICSRGARWKHRPHFPGSLVNPDLNSTTMTNIPNEIAQLSHQKGFTRSAVDNIHNANCMGVPRNRKSFVCTMARGRHKNARLGLDLDRETDNEGSLGWTYLVATRTVNHKVCSVAQI